MAVLPSKLAEMSSRSEDAEEEHSPVSPLPLYQQRENFFT